MIGYYSNMLEFDIIRKGIELPTVMELNWTSPDSYKNHDYRCWCIWCRLHFYYYD